MVEAQDALKESHDSLVKAEHIADDTAAIAARLKKELHDNHFAPALAAAIARSLR